MITLTSRLPGVLAAASLSVVLGLSAPARSEGQAAASPAANPALRITSRPSPAAALKADQAVRPAALAAPAPRRRGPRPAARLGRPLAALDRANAEAREGPASGVFINSALYHPFEPGRLYAIHTSPRFLTTLALRPGEKLISKAAGDTVRWVLGETVSGAGETLQVIVFVKPMRAGLRTNIVLTTDQRTYLIDAVSTDAAAYTSVLGWTYPQEEARARAVEAAGRQDAALAERAMTVQDGVPVERLDFRYVVETQKGRSPDWTPVRVFDDGAKTYIEFPPDLAVREAPPLFLLGSDGQAQLVNYRLVGRYLVVDRLIDRAELRLGDKRPQVVRIVRQGARS